MRNQVAEALSKLPTDSEEVAELEDNGPDLLIRKRGVSDGNDGYWTDNSVDGPNEVVYVKSDFSETLSGGEISNTKNEWSERNVEELLNRECLLAEQCDEERSQRWTSNVAMVRTHSHFNK